MVARAEEQPRFSSDRDGSQGALGGVVLQTESAVVEELPPLHPIPRRTWTESAKWWASLTPTQSVLDAVNDTGAALGEAIDERDHARGAGERRAPLLERELGDDGSMGPG